MTAQQSQPLRRIGHLRAGLPPERELQALLRGLADNGYVQGQNYVLVTQWGDGNVARLPELAVALVNAGVDIIVTEGTISVRAAHAVTGTIPIVFTRAADPFVFGLIKILARPGGNITGFSSLNVDIAGKTLELLRRSSQDSPRLPPWRRARCGICFLRPITRPLNRLGSRLSTLR